MMQKTFVVKNLVNRDDSRICMYLKIYSNAFLQNAKIEGS